MKDKGLTYTFCYRDSLVKIKTQPYNYVDIVFDRRDKVARCLDHLLEKSEEAISCAQLTAQLDPPPSTSQSGRLSAVDEVNSAVYIGFIAFICYR